MKHKYTWHEAREFALEVKKAGGQVVTTNGCFDVLHRGHVEYLTKTRALGDCLIVGINSDLSIKRLKGKGRPIFDEDSRAFVLSSLRSVDAVCIFDEDTPVDWLKIIKPDIHTKGGDYDPQKLPETPALVSWGGQIRILPFIDGYSTSKVVEKIRNMK